MIELLLNTLGYNGQINFPDSGPGNKNLISGNDTIGFFGEILPVDLISSTAFLTHLGLNDGAAVSESENTPWLKVLYRGKILFFTKNTLKSNLMWNHIYAAGGVYGTNDNGVVPATTPVNQYKPLTITEDGKDWILVPRIFKSTNDDPAQSNVTATVIAEGSEWNDITPRLMDGRLATYTMADLGQPGTNNSLLTQTTASGTNTNSCHRRGNRNAWGSVGVIGKATRDVNSFYKPVLELVPS